ncbi:D123-domain-containing protein [Aulographum hederae CBS 113979]|uniref:D123-domain-containing protein n=1 Tax=Aulographum hederae CBS 113979 TaxID=1176131 RepID=A0A6G1H3S6_9PEZI|nr:D123-domain-containing protein [Aulographum hederae CBS 113979]
MSEERPIRSLPFPPVTKTHILNCSYHSWHPRYRSVTPKARLLPLSPPFLDYLRADGIVLPPDSPSQTPWSDSDSGIFSSDTLDEEDEDGDPSTQWRELHEQIQETIAELGGRVQPKLNWSAPKDATWINTTNNMECQTPQDIYLLLKSSDFVTHDLEHAFTDTVDAEGENISQADIPYHLILRKSVQQLNPSLEFRCFVRRRHLIAMCQREPNHFEFLFKMQDQLRSRIQEFFDVRLRDTFPDENFAFDVYVPPPHDRVWLVDVNPWAPRTDPLLFSWLELLTMSGPEDMEDDHADGTSEEEEISLPIRLKIEPKDGFASSEHQQKTEEEEEEGEDSDSDTITGSDSDVEEIFTPELRLIRKNDPEAYSFATQQYSAHKLPRDVVDASQGGEGLREFAAQWKEILAKRQEEDQAEDSEAD